ncbi:MAG: autotransporter-associated beta strand repeat-containing protein [Planctomycetaceae bacterium]|nr:autotransporter-associated beta strand repeat-containing protein [Planctomycetaceae bacterium]
MKQARLRRIASGLHRLLTWVCIGFAAVPAGAVDLFWDLNGTLSGAGSVPAGTWDASAAAWSTGATGSIATSAWTDGNTAVFSAGTDALGPFAVDVVGTRTITGLRFEEGSVTLNGGFLNLASEPTILVEAGASALINSTLTGAQNIILRKVGTTGLLSIGGHNNYIGDTTINGGGVVRALTADAFGSGTVTVNETNSMLEFGNVGTVTNNVVFSNVGSTKQLRLADSSSAAMIAGTVTIQATNSANFGFNANGGTLTLNSVQSTSGASLRTLGGGTVILAGANSLTGTASLGGGGTVVVSHVSAFSGASGVSVIESDTTLDLADGITFSAPTITIGNAGERKSLRLRSGATAAVYSANVTVSESTEGNFAVNAQGGTLTFQGLITSTTGAGLRQEGSGLVVLAPSGNNNISTRITLAGDDGTLRFATSGALNGSAPITISASNATLEIADGISMSKAITISNIGETKTLQLVAGAASGTFGGTITISESTPEAFRVDAGGGQLTISGQLTGTGGAGLRILGSGTVALSSGTNNYSGTTVINGGGAVVQLLSNGRLPIGNALTIASGTLLVGGNTDLTVGAWTMGGGNSGSTSTAQIGASRTVTMTGDFLYSAINNNQSALITGGTLALGASNRTFTVEDSSAATLDLQIESAIGGSGVGLTKAGSGILKLSSTNSYDGSTTFQAGFIEVGSLDRFGPSGSLLFNGGGLRWAAGSGFDVSTRTTSFSGSAWFDTNGNNVTISASIGGGGSGRLNKTGAGVLRLNGMQNLSGGVTVHAGVLSVGGTLTSAGGVVVGAAGSATLNGSGTIQAPITVTSSGVFSAGVNTAGSDQNGVGHITVAGVEWQPGAQLVFDFGGVEGTPGTDWDWISITDFGVALSGRQTVKVFSWNLSGSGAYGANTKTNPSSNFDPAAPALIDRPESSPNGINASYSWLWMTGVGLSDGFLPQVTVEADPGVFTVGGGAPYGQPQGTFWVSAYNNDLYLHYSSVPEPGSLTLIMIGPLVEIVRRRCRFK